MSKVTKARYKESMQESIELGRALQRLLWSGRLDSAKFQMEFVICYLLFLRSERSLASIRSLVRLSLSDDAMALVRVMVERSITAEYILLVGSEPASDFIDFQTFSAWRNYQEVVRACPSLAPNYPGDFVRELESAYEALQIRPVPGGTKKSRFGRGHDWTELSLLKRAEKVDSLLRAMKPKKTVSAVTAYHATYKKSAAYLHSSFHSIVRSIENGEATPDPISADMVNVTIGIHTRDKGDSLGVEALSLANLIAFQMITFISEVFEHKKARDWALKFAKKKFASAKLREIQPAADNSDPLKS